VAQILREVQPQFVFEFRTFVVRYLDKAKQHGKDALDEAIDALWVSAIAGGRSGTPGEPFPQDLSMKADSEKALADMSRFSPAYRLYSQIKEHAEHNIQWSLREREATED
jgi:hypothetical protein